MQEVIVEQIFCRTGDYIASLRRAGAAQCDDSGRLPHRALLPLELRGLSLPDAASAVDGNAVLLDLFYLGQGPAGGGPHRRRAHAAQSLRPSPLRSGPDRQPAAGPALHGRSGGIL